MKRVIVAAIIALVLLLVPSTANAISNITVIDRTGDGVWDGNIWKVEMFPGETKSTTLTIRNSSGTSVSVSLGVTPEVAVGDNLTFVWDSISFTLTAGQEKDATLMVEASPSAEPRTYTAELVLEYEPLGSNPYAWDWYGGYDVGSLKISRQSTTNVTETTADIAWTTSRASTSRVTYWASPDAVVIDNSYVREHLVHLTGLGQNTAYYFKAESRDRYGKKASFEGDFTTCKREVIPVIPEPTPPLPEPTPPPEIVKPEPIPATYEPETVLNWSLVWGLAGLCGIVAGGLYLLRWKRKKKEKEVEKV